jgi:hypothetical protein
VTVILLKKNNIIIENDSLILRWHEYFDLSYINEYILTNPVSYYLMMIKTDDKDKIPKVYFESFYENLLKYTKSIF